MAVLAIGAIAGIVGKAILSTAVGLGATWAIEKIFTSQAGQKFLNNVGNYIDNVTGSKKAEVSEKTEGNTENNPTVTEKVETPNQELPSTTDKTEVETPNQELPSTTDKTEVEQKPIQTPITPTMNVPNSAGTLTPGVGLGQIEVNPGFNAGTGILQLPNTNEMVQQNPDVANKTPNQPNVEVNVMPNTTDKTEENKNQSIPNGSVNEFQAWFEEQKKWREEQQKHLEQRQDSAYSRAVADLRRSGINPNLLGSITPAQSDAGITTGINASSNELISMLQTYSDELQQFIDNNFKEDENAKDRFTEIFGKFTQGLTLLLFRGLM